MKKWISIIALVLVFSGANAQRYLPFIIAPQSSGGGGVALTGSFTNITMPRFAMAQVGGTKIRLANIVPRPTDSGNGDYGVPANFYDLLYQWGQEGTNSTAWTQWIKPQIDAMHGLGANAVRFMFDSTVWVGDASHHGAATWQGTNSYPMLSTMLNQLTAYLASQNMYLYACGSDIRPMDASGLTWPVFVPYFTNYISMVSQYNNVLGIDIMQEANGDGTNSVAALNVSNVFVLAKQYRQRLVPYTCSINGTATGADFDPSQNTWIGTVLSYSPSYIDSHCYSHPGITNVDDIDPLINNASNLPVIMAEMGVSYNGLNASGATNSLSAPRRQQFIQGLTSFGNRYDMQLAGEWASVPQTTFPGDDFGLMDSNQVPVTFAFNSPRVGVVNLFQQIPTNTQPLNSPFNVILGANTTASDYGPNTSLGVQNGLYDVAGSIWQVQSGAMEGLADNATEATKRLNQTTLPYALGQTVNFQIPPGRTYTPGSGFVTWGTILRTQPNGDCYGVELVSDTSGANDNKLQWFKQVSGTITAGGNSQQYSPSHPLDLTKRWSVNIVVSTNVSPTTITVTESNVTDGVLMTPSLVISDSSVSLQHSGSMGFVTFLGTPFYDNISLADSFDQTPELAISPSISHSTGTATFTWNAAQGNGTPVIYLPQLVPVDANGFPKTNWLSAVTTNGLSQTIAGLTNGNYSSRILLTDGSNTNFSPWSKFTIP